MIKLGDIIEVSNAGENTKKAWLTKRADLIGKIDGVYFVMGFIPNNGWYSAFNGTLSECRQYMEKIR